MKADRFPFSAVGASSSSHDDDDRRHRRRRPTSRTLYAALVSLLLASLLILWKLDSVLAVTCSTSAVSRQTRLCFGYRARPATVGPPPDDRETARPPSLDGWLEIEREVAWRGILDNIGPAAGAAPGLVVASPSTAHPDYFYTWTRDSALTFATILDRFLPSSALDGGGFHAHQRPSPSSLTSRDEPELESLLREYVSSQCLLQRVPNPSGGLLDGGLGEPKFTALGAAFEGSWGRPQRDGPALRALVTGRFASFLLDRDRPLDEPYVRSILYDAGRLIAPNSVLKSDLEYIAHAWREPSFDIWEEVSGTHFFTLLASRAALVRGARVAKTLADSGAAAFYLAEAAEVTRALEQFWLPEEGHISAMLDPEAHSRSGLDAAVLLAVLRVGPPATAGRPVSWSVADDRVLATVERYVESFAGGLYAINNATGSHSKRYWHGAIAVGRYAEDIYDGDGKSAANPWFITTFAVSEILHRIAAHALASNRIVVSPIALAFWQTIDHSLTSGLVLERSPSKGKDGRFERVVDSLLAYADGFLRVGQTFASPGGTLSEQFSRLDGSPTGAQNLTWSYASLLDAADARQSAYDLRL